MTERKKIRPRDRESKTLVGVQEKGECKIGSVRSGGSVLSGDDGY